MDSTSRLVVFVNAVRHRFWVVSTYFAEGFPYSLVRQISTVYFKDAGASLQTVGLTSLYGLPWILKLLWAPILDAYSTKRRWLVALEVFLAASTIGLAAVSGLASPLAAASVFFLITGFLSATHDIAIDGFYLESLDRAQQARFVGYQAMSYRGALVLGGGGILWLSGRTSWTLAFAVAAGLLLALAAYHGAAPPPGESPKRPLRDLAAGLVRARTLLILAAVFLALYGAKVGWGALSTWPAAQPALQVLSQVDLATWVAGAFALALLALLAGLPALKRRMAKSDSFYGQAFVTYLEQPRLWAVLGFLLTYRTGESFLLAMVYPLLKEIGIGRAKYGIIYGTFGITASIAGGILGGHLISRFGLKRMAFPLALGQGFPNLFYMLLAYMYRGILGHPELGTANPYLVTVFVVAESFGSGLGTAVFMVFIQRTCKPAYKAGHFAMATGIANISATFAGVLSGILAHAMGFTFFFGLTFLATLPGVALIFFLPYLDGSCAQDRPVEEGGK